jgi:hypothetical protein
MGGDGAVLVNSSSEWCTLSRHQAHSLVSGPGLRQQRRGHFMPRFYHVGWWYSRDKESR